MQKFEDFYEELGVSPNASAEEIKRAFLDKSYILHPDRLAGAPESARTKAEAELKRVNVAYDALKDRLKRRDYDAKWRLTKEKPKPVVDPPLMRFINVKPSEILKGTFTIRNVGGPYNKINISNPDSWVKVVKWVSVTNSDELPLRVEIEAEAEDWGKSYLESVIVRLDDEETQVKIQLQSRPESTMTIPPGSTHNNKPDRHDIKRLTTKSLYSWIKLLIDLTIIACFIGTVITGILAFTQTLTPIIGALSFIFSLALFITFIVITRSVRYRWLKPSFGLVFLCVVGVYLVLTFSGIQPLADYKDSAFNEILRIYNSIVKP